MIRTSSLRLLTTLSFAFGACSLALLPSKTALAQDATAGPLFDKGMADMEAGHFDTACPAIAESHRLDPHPGTLFTLAECYAKAGKLSSATARYQDYLELYARMTPEEQSKQQGRDKISQSQLQKLGPDVPKLTLKLPPGAQPGIEVKRDGVILGAASLGLALPVDPGDHAVTTQEPGGPVSTLTVTIGKGEKKEVMLVVKVPDSSGGTSSGGTTSVGPTGGDTGASATSAGDPSRGDGQRIAGIVVGSVGIAGVIAGAATGGITLSKKDTVAKNCSAATKTCNQTGFDAMNGAKTTGAVSTAMFIIGPLVTAGGIIVFVTAPKASKGSPATHVGFFPSPGGGAIAAWGEF